MTRTIRWTALLAIGMGLCFSPMVAQQPGGGPGMGIAPNASEITSRPDVAPDQRAFRDNVYNRQVDHGRRPSKTQVISEASRLLDSIQVPCKINDAALAAQGPAEIGSRTIETKTYEVSCDSGLGYFAVSADTNDAFSCFAADATRAKDLAAGKPPSLSCMLAANKDVKAMVAATLGRLGVQCEPSGVKWIGMSAKAKTEFVEVACPGGTGFVITIAAPGSGLAPAATSCPEAAKRGLLCTMSSNGQPVININTFRTALVEHHIACSAADDSVHLIGQETVSRRHVVEFRCAEHPDGLVAFIPLEDKSKAFETMNCAAAAKRQAKCVLH